MPPRQEGSPAPAARGAYSDRVDEMPVASRPARSLRVLLDPPNPALALRLGLEPDIDVVASTMSRPAVALVEELDTVPA
ncbi:hypothetical protein E0702_17320, partial [Halomonas marinisediminis]